MLYVTVAEYSWKDTFGEWREDTNVRLTFPNYKSWEVNNRVVHVVMDNQQMVIPLSNVVQILEVVEDGEDLSGSGDVRAEFPV